MAREVGRLKISLDAGKKLQEQVLAEEGRRLEMLVFLHFPPYFSGYFCDELILELYRYDISRCYFGHIHGNYDVPLTQNYMDIDFTLISADYLNFTPLCIEPQERREEQDL